MDKQSNSTTVPETSTAEHPWIKARRLSKELSATLTECDNADWFAHVLPAELSANVFFGALPMGLKPDELPVDHINRLAWELSEALNRWNGGGYQAMVLPSERGGNTVMFSNIRAWDGRADRAETPSEELRRLAHRIMDILKSTDSRVEIATIRATAGGVTMMSGFDVPTPGFDQIGDFFHRWKEAEARADAAEDDEDADPAQAEYNALQDLIVEQAPRTAREFAMWILAQTDRWAAGITDELREMTDVLAGEKEGV